MRELEVPRGADVAAFVQDLREPAVIRGVGADWPLVKAARRSGAEAMAYLRGFYRNATVGAWYGPPEIRGRFFYNTDLSGFNFRAAMVKLDAVFDELSRIERESDPVAIYVGSTTIDTSLPGLRVDNDIPNLPADTIASIWLGNRTRTAAHFDMPDNLACVAVGHRRFTLFPPSQLPNLYVGPLEFTPAGQQVSLVDFETPDLARFPKFATALEHAQIADLAPGDAIFIPGMWWHHVAALDAFNVLINYWWTRSPAYMGAPGGALMHALLSLKGLPVEQREAWKLILEHYVFGSGDSAVEHLPENRRGILGPIDDVRARSLRALLLNQLNR